MENEKKLTRRIGSVTFGIMMILMGINIFLQSITSLDLFRFTLSLWPIIFVSLGVETLYYSFKKNVEIKYDLLGMLTIFVILFLGAIFSVVNYGINKVLYDDNIKAEIINYYADVEHNYNFNDRVYIDNKGNENVVVKFIENKNREDILVEVNFDYDESYEGNLLKLFRYRNKISNTFYVNYDEEKIQIASIPEFIKQIEITVTAKDKSKLIYNGEVIY
jgi:hypothetical protein